MAPWIPFSRAAVTVSILYSERVKLVMLVKEAGLQAGGSLGERRGEAVAPRARNRVVRMCIVMGWVEVEVDDGVACLSDLST